MSFSSEKKERGKKKEREPRNKTPARLRPVTQAATQASATQASATQAVRRSPSPHRPRWYLSLRCRRSNTLLPVSFLSSDSFSLWSNGFWGFYFFNLDFRWLLGVDLVGFMLCLCFVLQHLRKFHLFSLKSRLWRSIYKSSF